MFPFLKYTISVTVPSEELQKWIAAVTFTNEAIIVSSAKFLTKLNNAENGAYWLDVEEAPLLVLTNVFDAIAEYPRVIPNGEILLAWADLTRTEKVYSLSASNSKVPAATELPGLPISILLEVPVSADT